MTDNYPVEHAVAASMADGSANTGTIPFGTGSELLSRDRLDAFTHTRLWKNPCGFAARFNYLALRYNQPLYSWVEQEFGLSRIEFVVIYSLALMDGVTASEIASSTAFPKNTLSRAVNRLAKLGYIGRSTQAMDRRMQYLSLTPFGQAIYDAALPRFVAFEQEMLAPLSLVEQETLNALMAKVMLAMFAEDTKDDSEGDQERHAALLKHGA
jgi:DNA-binding MarR family transcriptional regulator